MIPRAHLRAPRHRGARVATTLLLAAAAAAAAAACGPRRAKPEPITSYVHVFPGATAASDSVGLPIHVDQPLRRASPGAPACASVVWDGPWVASGAADPARRVAPPAGEAWAQSVSLDVPVAWTILDSADLLGGARARVVARWARPSGEEPAKVPRQLRGIVRPPVPVDRAVHLALGAREGFTQAPVRPPARLVREQQCRLADGGRLVALTIDAPLSRYQYVVSAYWPITNVGFLTVLGSAPDSAGAAEVLRTVQSVRLSGVAAAP